MQVEKVIIPKRKLLQMELGYTSKGVDKGRDFRNWEDLTKWILLWVPRVSI